MTSSYLRGCEFEFAAVLLRHPSAEGMAAEMFTSLHVLLLSSPSLLCRWRKTGDVGEVLALCISRRTCQVLACDAAGVSVVWVDFPCFRAGLGAHQAPVSRHGHCAAPQRWLPLQMFGVAAPSPRCRSGGGAAGCDAPAWQESQLHPPLSAVLRGGGGPAWAAAPSPKCCSRDGCGFGVRRRSRDDTTSYPQWGGQQRRGFAQSRPGGAGSHPLHLSVTAAAPSLLCCSSGRGRRTSVGSACALWPPPPHGTTVE